MSAYILIRTLWPVYLAGQSSVKYELRVL